LRAVELTFDAREMGGVLETEGILERPGGCFREELREGEERREVDCCE
jgi:hypothetical protein